MGHRYAELGLGILLVVAGIAHFAVPTTFKTHLPAWIPGRLPLILLTGAIELAFAAILIFKPDLFGSATGWALAAYFVAIFPGNVYAAVSGVHISGYPVWARYVRLPLQIPLIALAIWIAVVRGRE